MASEAERVSYVDLFRLGDQKKMKRTDCEQQNLSGPGQERGGGFRRCGIWENVESTGPPRFQIW